MGRQAIKVVRGSYGRLANILSSFSNLGGRRRSWVGYAYTSERPRRNGLCHACWEGLSPIPWAYITLTHRNCRFAYEVNWRTSCQFPEEPAAFQNFRMSGAGGSG